MFWSFWGTDSLFISIQKAEHHQFQTYTKSLNYMYMYLTCDVLVAFKKVSI